jgi:hypothetical protein
MCYYRKDIKFIYLNSWCAIIIQYQKENLTLEKIGLDA